MAEQDALITVAPDATVDDIIKQVKQAGASHVDVLFPDGAPAFQSRKACDRLREMANRESIGLTFYTDDEKIIKAAQTCQIDVIPVDPSAFHPVAAAPTAPPAVAAPSASTPTPQLNNAEADFLRSLDALPEITPISTGPLAASEDPWASVNSFAVDSAPPAKAPTKAAEPEVEDDWFSALNDLSATLDAEAGATTAPPTPTRPRIRPEDIELSDADLHRQTKQGRREAREERDRSARGKSSRPGSKNAKAKKGAAKSFPISTIVIGMIVVLALLGAWFLFFRNSGVTVQVALPTANRQTFEDVRVIFQQEPVTDPSSAAVQGHIVESLVSVSLSGTVQEATEVPDQTARGAITIYNRLTQDIPLPAGTMFATVNVDGTQVQYRTTEDIVVPGASVSLAGSQNGVASVGVQAAAGGAAYNLPPRTDVSWLSESYGDAFIVINEAPIEGGTNKIEKIPTQNDIQALLPQAIPMLASQANLQLQSALPGGEALAGVALSPTTEELAQNPNLYTVSTEPIPDTDGGFKMVVTANFKGLAVPTTPEANLVDVLKQRALPNALKLSGFNPDTAEVISYTLQMSDEGNVLLADVTTAPKDRDAATLPAELDQRLRADLAGKTLAEANATLSDYVNRELIRSFQLPENLETMPDDPAAINFEVTP